MARLYQDSEELSISGTSDFVAVRSVRVLYLPIRYITNKFGGTISWNPETWTATTTIDGKTVMFQRNNKSAGGVNPQLTHPPFVDLDSRMYVDATDLDSIWGIGTRVSGSSVAIEKGIGVSTAIGLNPMMIPLAAIALGLTFFRKRWVSNGDQ